MLSSAPICTLMSMLMLILFCIGFGVYAKMQKDTGRSGLQYAAGIILGLIAISLTLCKIEYEGVAFDFRTVMLCLCGLFFGTKPAAIATAMTAALVLVQGADNATPSALAAECTYTASAGIIGILFGDASRKWRSSKSIPIIAGASMITQMVTAICAHMSGCCAESGHLWEHLVIILVIMPTTATLTGILITRQIGRMEIIHQYKILEDKYYKLSLCNDDTFWELDSVGKITYVSANITQTLGYEPDEIIGQKPHFIIEDVQSIQRLTKYAHLSAKPGQEYFRNELVLKHKKGNNVYCDTRGMCIIDQSNQQVAGYICITRNVTNVHLHNELSRHNQKFIREQTIRLNKLQKDIEDYKQKLIQANKDIAEAQLKSNQSAKKQMMMLANVCNEIIPATDDIYKYIRIIRDQSQTEATRSAMLDQMLFAAEFLKSISNDLIDSTYLANGLTKLSLSISNIADAIAEICDYHNSRNTYLYKKPVILQHDIKLRPDETTVKTDIQHLKHIINILITNAYAFTNAGQITVSCSLQSDTELLISVSDTGIGVPEAAYKNMFKSIDQTDLPQTTKKIYYKHTVFGLSIAKSLVELMGGQIWFVSDVGKGTTISFTTPFIKAGEMASQANIQYKWQDHTALIATTNRYSSILASETLAKTHIRYNTMLISADGRNTSTGSQYFKHYDVIISDTKATTSPPVQQAAKDNPSAALITIDGSTTPAALCKQIDKHFTPKP